MKFEYDRFDLPKASRESMITMGTLGQLAFGSYLKSSAIEHEFEFQAGEFDQFDFKIRSELWEVKTSGYQDSFKDLNLLYSADQFTRGIKLNYKYCIQLFVNGYVKERKALDLSRVKVAFIVGGIELGAIKMYRNERKYFGDDYKVPLSQLISIQKLLAL
jgi:hypothetical protein